MALRPLGSFALLSAAALAVLSPAAAQAQMEDYPSQERYHLRGEYREFRPNLDAVLLHGSSSKEGTPVDLTDDLAVPDERTFEIRGAIQIKRGHKIRGSYTPLEYQGDQPESPKNFTYGNTDFRRFERVVSSFKGAYYSLSYEWDFLRGSRGYLGALLGGRVIDMDAVIAAPERGLREVNTVRTPVPALGLAGRVYAGRLSLEGEFAGFSMGSRGSVWEFETSARLHVSDRLAVEGGYRRLAIDGEDGFDNGDVTVKGWLFGLELSL